MSRETADAKGPVWAFFAYSNGFVDYIVLRPLSHIRSNWELTWDDETKQYEAEEDSMASLLNDTIADLARTAPPADYHYNEDVLAEYVIKSLKWPIRKEKGRWVGAHYDAILEQGGFDDIDQCELLSAAAGRIRAALIRGQRHFDDMEQSHQRMLGAVLTIILYHRWDASLA